MRSRLAYLKSVYAITVLFVAVLFALYFGFVKSDVERMQNNIYKSQASAIKQELSSLIEQKQKATLALGLSLAQDKALGEFIVAKNIPQTYYQEFITQLTAQTLYKNVWVQVLDAKGTSLYRSWTNLKGDDLSAQSEEVKKILQDKQSSSCVSVGKFDLSIKSLVPIFHHGDFIGVLEVITHFNSITKTLSQNKIGSVILIDPKYKPRITHPFTKMFLDDYYIANLDAPKELRKYLRLHNTRSFLDDAYRVQDGYLIASYPLNDETGHLLGHTVMFKKLSDLKSSGIEYFTFRLTALFIIFSMVLFFVLGGALFIRNRRQKYYYKNILDSSSNIMIINDGKRLLDANKTFFKYFHHFTSLEQFSKVHRCVCEFFVAQEGYIQFQMGSLYWVHYVFQNPHLDHKVKIDYHGEITYFNVSVSKILEDEPLYSIVFSDITKQEQYQQELLDLSTKDALTGVYNRHFYNQKIAEEIARAQRYGEHLSLILLDIDNFKNVNDLHGHDIGDNVLIEYSELITKNLRKTDILCRIGGEEFVIILPHTSINEAEILANKLRAQIETFKLILPITMSFGVVTFLETDDAQTLLKRANKALYMAKEHGRNRVVLG
jgi:diguanylate cyclase (GGDEF)-like protein